MMGCLGEDAQTRARSSLQLPSARCGGRGCVGCGGETARPHRPGSRRGTGTEKLGVKGKLLPPGRQEEHLWKC